MSIWALAAVAGVVLGTFLVLTAAAGPQGVCAGLDSGRVNVQGNQTSITVQATSGRLIAGYCFKAGNRAGPQVVQVSPPRAVVTIDGGGRNLVHYSLDFEDSTPTETPAVPTETSLTPTEGPDPQGPSGEPSETPVPGTTSPPDSSDPGAGDGTSIPGGGEPGRPTEPGEESPPPVGSPEWREQNPDSVVEFG